MRVIEWRAFALLGLLMFLAPVLRAEAPVQGEDPRLALKREFEAALQAMDAARQKGPQDIPIAGQAVLRLPEGFDFVPNPAASRFVKAMGNPVDDSFQGLILPRPQGGEALDWLVSVSFEKSGYIKDDDAKSWNTDEMLKNLKEGVEEVNQARAERGIPGLELVGWAEPPAYDAAAHRLVWALTVASQGAPADQPQSVNYNTHALGREGYISLNLVTSSAELAARKPVAQTLLASLEFNQGKRYEDFNADSDPTAAFGLAALVGGAMVAKKFGLFALAGLFLAKFGKVIAVAAAALFGIFGRRAAGKKGQGGSLDA